MKNDPILGQKVHQHLMKIGMETPIDRQTTSKMTDEDKIEKIEHAVRQIMDALELDLSDDSLADTPKRVAKMYVKELYNGLDYEHFPKCTVIENKMEAGMVIEKDVKIMSNCEHHLLILHGFATIAYIPNKKVLGLSKINRIADFFARRPQVQERLTNQIWHTMKFILDTDDVAVYIDATHMCVKARGVSDASSSTVTSRLGGQFMSDPAVRAEFMALAKG